ncbi:MAG: 4'-phosphopantetheinyl transferase superfamily protein [Parasporobacterium sp.]|nr:4'-phosphopantetheinyl transferase superfamily protein [Parasporobacterium sp.]
MIRTYLINIKSLEELNLDESIITPKRVETTARYKNEPDKQLSYCAELALIYGLKQLDPEMALPLDIEVPEEGKPFLKTLPAGFENLYFNLSHSGDYAVASISDEEIGVDIEHVSKRGEMSANRILHPDENQIYNFISNPLEKKRYFYECWVSKESFLKNLGVGLMVRPDKFMINEDKLVTDETKTLKKRYVHIYSSEEVKRSDLKFHNFYRLAVCSMTKDPDATCEILTVDQLKAVI